MRRAEGSSYQRGPTRVGEASAIWCIGCEAAAVGFKMSESPARGLRPSEALTGVRSVRAGGLEAGAEGWGLRLGQLVA